MGFTGIRRGILIGLVVYIIILILLAKSLWNDSESSLFQQDRRIRIGIGLAIDSVGVTLESEREWTKQFSFLHTLVPSFCKTASRGYGYVFYLAYDYDDTLFSSSAHRTEFLWMFRQITSEECGAVSVSITFIRCDYSHHPAWAKNDAMWQAYLNGHDYLFRIHPGIIFLNPGWTERLISLLQGSQPPNVGMVGYKEYRKESIKWEFVHRTHCEIFGFFYPRLFTDFFANRWMTSTYQNERSRTTIIVYASKKAEYHAPADPQGGMDKGQLMELWKGKAMLERYVQSLANSGQKAQADKVIGCSLPSSQPRDVSGALRLAQQRMVYFPEWTLRFYVRNSSAIQQVIVGTLLGLKAEVAAIPQSFRNLPPHLWPYVLVEEENVDYFLVRNTTHRFSERESSAVRHWLKNSWPMYGIRDHNVSHQDGVLTEGLWGGKGHMIRTLMGRTTFKNLLFEKYDILNNYERLYLPHKCRESNDTILQDCLAPYMVGHIYFHDSLYCEPKGNTYPMPASSALQESCRFWPHELKKQCHVGYIGQQHDEFQVPVDGEWYNFKEC